MKLYTCTNHEGYWPVGVASIVLAEDEDQARVLLNAELVKWGLTVVAKRPYTLRELDLSKVQAVVLIDGEY